MYRSENLLENIGRLGCPINVLQYLTTRDLTRTAQVNKKINIAVERYFTLLVHCSGHIELRGECFRLATNPDVEPQVHTQNSFFKYINFLAESYFFTSDASEQSKKIFVQTARKISIVYAIVRQEDVKGIAPIGEMTPKYLLERGWFTALHMLTELRSEARSHYLRKEVRQGNVQAVHMLVASGPLLPHESNRLLVHPNLYSKNSIEITAILVESRKIPISYQQALRALRAAVRHNLPDSVRRLLPILDATLPFRDRADLIDRALQNRSVAILDSLFIPHKEVHSVIVKFLKKVVREFDFDLVRAMLSHSVSEIPIIRDVDRDAIVNRLINFRESSKKIAMLKLLLSSGPIKQSTNDKIKFSSCMKDTGIANLVFNPPFEHLDEWARL